MTMNYFENIIACAVTLRKWEVRKQLKRLQDYAPTLEQHIKKGDITATQRIFQCPEYKALVSFDSEFSTWCRMNSVPTLLKRGIYGVPKGHLAVWQAHLEEKRVERQALCQLFYAVYPDEVTKALQERQGLVREEEYPSQEELPGYFSLTARYIDLGVPASLGMVNSQLYQAAQKQLQEEIRQTTAAVEGVLLQEITALTQGLHAALTGLDDGTLKRFHVSHIEKLQQWADLFLTVRNVTGFTALETVVHHLQTMVTGRGAELRDMPHERQAVKHEMGEILVQLKGLMVEKGLRDLALLEE